MNVRIFFLDVTGNSKSFDPQHHVYICEISVPDMYNKNLKIANALKNLAGASVLNSVTLNVDACIFGLFN